MDSHILFNKNLIAVSNPSWHFVLIDKVDFNSQMCYNSIYSHFLAN